MTPKSRRIDLATGLGYHVLEWGGQDSSLGHTVLLIHGFLDLGWSFAPMVRQELCGHFHVVAPDMRGHGDSDRVGAGGYYHFFDYLADLDSLVSQVGRDRVSLVGHSMGGMIASYYAGMQPDSIHRLAILEGIVTPEYQGLDTRARESVDFGLGRASGKSNPTYDNVAAAAERLAKHDPHLSKEMALELATRGTAPAPGGVQFKHDPIHVTRGPYPFTVAVASQFWQRITCPVLLVDAEESSFQLDPADYARRKACIPHAHTLTLPNAGHLMHRHQPGLLGKHLREFLSG